MSREEAALPVRTPSYAVVASTRVALSHGSPRGGSVSVSIPASRGRTRLQQLQHGHDHGLCRYFAIVGASWAGVIGAMGVIWGYMGNFFVEPMRSDPRAPRGKLEVISCKQANMRPRRVDQGTLFTQNLSCGHVY